MVDIKSIIDMAELRIVPQGTEQKCFVEIKDVAAWEERLYEKLEAEHAELLARMENGEWSDDDVKELEVALASMRR